MPGPGRHPRPIPGRLNDSAPTFQTCAGSAALERDGGFVATVPVSCLGDPASIGYVADMRWDTDPTNDEATDDTGVVTDMAPDDGMPAGPVTKP